MLASIKGIYKQYNSEVLFSNISFTIEEGHKIALVGRNGIGKSTLIKIIAGVEDPDNGSVSLSEGRTLAYLPQEIPIGETKTGIEYIQDGTDFMPHQFLPILQGLGVYEEVLNQPVNIMSGGQQTKILLTRFLLQPADILLLDEPTNNLDIPSLLWLELFLAESKKSMLIVSHDLVFLDTVANRVFELNETGINCERGTYTNYLDRKKKELKKQRRDYKMYREKVEQLEGNIQTLQTKGEIMEDVEHSDNDKQMRNFKIGSAEKRQSGVSVIKTRLRKLEKMEKPFIEDPFTLEVEARNLDTASIKLEDVFVGYENGIKVGPVNLNIKAGTRVCIMGANGSGKSTILKTLIGLLPALEGEINVSEGVIFGDLLQQHDRADRKMKALDFFVSQTKTNKEKGIYMLKKSGFGEQNLNQDIGELSSGMRARLLFGVFVTLGVNILILDEPTNHLDMEGVAALKELLKEYKGAVIIVSHNRWFLKDLNIDIYYKISEGIFERISDFAMYISDAQKQAEKLVQRIKRVSQSISS